MSTEAFKPSPQGWHPHAMLHSFAEYILGASRDIAAQFKDPDDDWQPVAFFISVIDGKPGVAIMPVPGPMMNSGAGKQAIADTFANFVTGSKMAGREIVAGAFICSAWHKLMPNLSDLPPEAREAIQKRIIREGLKDEPDKSEVLILQLATLNGVTILCAKIERDGFSPPRIVEEFRAMVYPGCEGKMQMMRFMEGFQPLLAPLPAPEEVIL